MMLLSCFKMINGSFTRSDYESANTLNKFDSLQEYLQKNQWQIYQLYQIGPVAVSCMISF